MGDTHSGIVSLTESCFPCVGEIPDLRILRPDFRGFLFLFFSDQDNTTNDKEQYQPGFHDPKGSGSKRDLQGDWRGSNSNYCLLLSSWTTGSTRPALSWLLRHEAEQMCLLLMRWRMELFFWLIEIRCTTLRSALQTDGDSMQAPSENFKSCASIFKCSDNCVFLSRQAQ